MTTKVNIEQVWLNYKHQLERFLLSKVSNPSDVEELLQDILLKTHTQLPTLEKQASLKSWLFTIANNSIIDFYRSRQVEEPFIEELNQADQLNENISKSLSHCLQPFIQALDDDSAQLLTEIELGNISQKQYAKTHDIAYSTLKSRVQKSRTQLKRLFEQCCSFEFDKQGNLIEFYEKSNTCKKC